MLTTDLDAIADAVHQTLGVSREEIISRARLEQDRYPAKVVFCRMLRERGYGYGTIAEAMNTTKSGVYTLVAKHNTMLTGDTLYRRTYETIKKQLR